MVNSDRKYHRPIDLLIPSDSLDMEDGIYLAVPSRQSYPALWRTQRTGLLDTSFLLPHFSGILLRTIRFTIMRCHPAIMLGRTGFALVLVWQLDLQTTFWKTNSYVSGSIVITAIRFLNWESNKHYFLSYLNINI